MKLNDPFSKEELKSSVNLLKENLANVFEKIDENMFFQAPNHGWSLAENVQHINKVTNLLRLSYSTPKFLASFVFGEGDNPSRRMQTIGDIYLDALAKGQNAGPFTPNNERIDVNINKRKSELLKELNRSFDKYALALENWSEEQLDKILMPHPFLGKLTAREMYMIGLLHPIHHCNIVSKRLNQEWSYF